MGTPASSRPLRIAVFISGGGTTLKNLIARIDAGQLSVKIVLVVSSNPNAGGLRYADAAGIPFVVVNGVVVVRNGEHTGARPGQLLTLNAK